MKKFQTRAILVKICGASLALGLLAGCGLRGPLERPAPLWGAETASEDLPNVVMVEREEETAMPDENSEDSLEGVVN